MTNGLLIEAQPPKGLDLATAWPGKNESTTECFPKLLLTLMQSKRERETILLRSGSSSGWVSHKRKKNVMECPPQAQPPFHLSRKEGDREKALTFRGNPCLKKTGVKEEHLDSGCLFCLCYCFSGAYQSRTNIHKVVGQWCFLCRPLLICFLCPSLYCAVCLIFIGLINMLWTFGGHAHC